MTSHVIFDFFGTLVAYSPSRTDQGYPESHAFYTSEGGSLDYAGFLACWSAAFSELDAATAGSLREYSMDEAVRAFQRHASLPAAPGVLARLASLYLEEWSAGVHAIDGVSTMLGRLAKRFDLSIITNTHDAGLVPAQLQRMGVGPVFSQVVTSVSFGVRKPSPAIFEFALGGLAASPSQCLYVGDSHVPDFEGPRAAGIRALLIDPDGTAPVAPHERIASVLDLEAVLTAV